MALNVLKLAEMTWVEVDELDQDRTVIFLPLSPIEAHGPHLPIGTDMFGARDIAAMAAQLVCDADPPFQAILAPTIPLGCADIAADFPGTVSLKGTTLCHVVVDFCSALAHSGFKHMVIANHHLDPVHLKAVLTAIEDVTARHEVGIIENIGRIVYSGMETEAYSQGQALGLDMQTEIHGDVRETSFIMHQYPHLIKTDPEQLPPVRIDVRKGLKKGHKTFKAMGATQGYLGTPALASASYGRLHIEEISRLTADMAIKLLNGGPLPEIHPAMIKFLDTHIRL